MAKFENLDIEWKKLCDIIEIKASLSHENKTDIMTHMRYLEDCLDIDKEYFTNSYDIYTSDINKAISNPWKLYDQSAFTWDQMIKTVSIIYGDDANFYDYPNVNLAIT